MTLRNTSKTRSKTPVELLLGRRVRLPAIADFDLCKPILFKANEKTKTVLATFIIRKGLNTSFIQPENSTRTNLVSDNQIARLEENKVKTEPGVGETISQSEAQLQNTDEHLHIRMKLYGHISCRAPTTQTTRAFTNINKKKKTSRQIWRTCTHKLA